MSLGGPSSDILQLSQWLVSLVKNGLPQGVSVMGSVRTEARQPVFSAVLPDLHPLKPAGPSLSLASFSFIVTRPQIRLWLGRPQSKASLAEGWDP